LKISTRGRYGTRALVEIALNKGQPVSIKQISGTTDISSRYLEQILRQLKKRGLLDTVQGIKGGFILKKDPYDITVREVIDILEGEDYPVACAVDDGVCEKYGRCATGELWKQVRKAMVEVFEKNTIGSLLKRQIYLDVGDR